METGTRKSSGRSYRMKAKRSEDPNQPLKEKFATHSKKSVATVGVFDRASPILFELESRSTSISFSLSPSRAERRKGSSPLLRSTKTFFQSEKMVRSSKRGITPLTYVAR